MTTVLFDGVVHTSYGQFDIIWGDSFGFDGVHDTYFAGQVNGLVGAAHPSDIYVVLARWGGGSDMRIELCEDEPHVFDESWADVVEVSVSVPEGSAPRWASWSGESGGPLALPPADYRVRVSAKGRDAGSVGEGEEEVVDHYVVQFWPKSPVPDTVIRSHSENGRYFHRAIGGRR